MATCSQCSYAFTARSSISELIVLLHGLHGTSMHIIFGLLMRQEQEMSQFEHDEHHLFGHKAQGAEPPEFHPRPITDP